jgi:gliding motility-associated-like protein
MRKLPVLLFISLLTVSMQAQMVVSGIYYEYKDNLSGTGVDKVYLFSTLNNATITYASSAVSVSFYRYTNALSDKEKIPDSDISTFSSGNTTTYVISDLQNGKGYLVEENGGTSAPVWIIDYSRRQPVLNSIEAIENEDKCELLKLFVNKSENELAFYGVSGNKRDIPRKYTVSYTDQEWDESDHLFKNKTVELKDREIGTEIIISAPLMNTQFKLHGDQFAEHFNIAKEIVSQPYTAIAVESHIVAEKEERNIPNEMNTEEGGSIVGSAPVVINFYEYANEPVSSFYTWLIYNRNDLENPVARYTDKDIRYTFGQSGDFVVKLEVADRNSICVDTVSVSVKVTESELQEPPNYFTPDSSPGVNDEFRVAYKSLIKFKCTIFNRWGTKLYQWTDPAKGWDGKYNGKYVNTGVYFYVIEAEGSDGIKYKKGGDINILRKR